VKENCFQPVKVSGMSTLQRSASSLVEPGLRFSMMSKKRVPPVLLP
jgi:hypothetical protein